MVKKVAKKSKQSKGGEMTAIADAIRKVSTERMMHPCGCTIYNGGQCYNCLNGFHAGCDGNCNKKVRKSAELNVGDSIKVWWSNGAGYSIYRIADNSHLLSVNPNHLLVAHSHWEICSDGKYKEVT